MGWPIVPYVGVGLGMGWTDISNTRGVVNTRSGPSGVTSGAGVTNGTTTYTINDTSSQFAYQAIVGAAYLPSTATPVGSTDAGLPVGLQVVAPFLHDRLSIRVSSLLAEAGSAAGG
jgi:hypothetical protein